jgi:hypothetical protein
VLAGDGEEPAWVETWLCDVTRTGLLARNPGESETLLASAAACLAALPPAAGVLIGRGQLAARHGAPAARTPSMTVTGLPPSCHGAWSR